MTEQLCWGATGNLIPIVKKLNCPPEALMMLARLPNTFLSDAEREKAVCLEKYEAERKI